MKLKWMEKRYFNLASDITRKIARQFKIPLKSIGPLHGGVYLMGEELDGHVNLQLKRSPKTYYKLKTLLETISHELAHININERTHHGPRWKKKYNKILTWAMKTIY